MDKDSGMEDINLLLVGRIGKGKSATGNSILGKKVFKTNNTETEPTVPMKGTSTQLGNTVTVVDGIDVDDKHDISILKERADTVFRMLTGGITAFIFVYRYRDRFTRQERETVKVIRSIFGEDVLKTHGVVVISHGDNFSEDHEDLNFDEWLASQTGHFKDTLIEDCGSRIVLFDNKAGPERMRKQQEELMSKVIEIKSISKPYTKEDMNKRRGHARQNAGSRLDENKCSPKRIATERTPILSGNKKRRLHPIDPERNDSVPGEKKWWWCDEKLFAMYSLCLMAFSCGVTLVIYWLSVNA